MVLIASVIVQISYVQVNAYFTYPTRIAVSSAKRAQSVFFVHVIVKKYVSEDQLQLPRRKQPTTGPFLSSVSVPLVGRSTSHHCCTVPQD